MPNLDGTGPDGKNSCSENGLGPCFGFGLGHGCRHHRGLGGFFHRNWPEDKEAQIKILSDYKKALEEELEEVRKEEAEIEKASDN